MTGVCAVEGIGIQRGGIAIHTLPGLGALAATGEHREESALTSVLGERQLVVLFIVSN